MPFPVVCYFTQNGSTVKGKSALLMAEPPLTVLPFWVMVGQGKKAIIMEFFSCK